jgi:hypothetical protein
MSEAHSPAYVIFHYKFNYSIPAIHFYSQEYLDTVGIVSTGDKAVDKEIMKNYIATRGTIMDIAKRFAEDVPVKLENARDSLQMYEAVRDHLVAWKQELAMGSNVGDAPVEDLRILDEFATSIFEIARRYKPELVRRKSMSTRLQSMGSSAGQTLRRGIPEATSNKPAAPKPLEVHSPMIDIIDDYFNRRNAP